MWKNVNTRIVTQLSSFIIIKMTKINHNQCKNCYTKILQFTKWSIQEKSVVLITHYLFLFTILSCLRTDFSHIDHFIIK